MVVVLQVEKNAFRLLAVALPCMLKAVTVHTEIDMPKLTPGTHSTMWKLLLKTTKKTHNLARGPILMNDAYTSLSLSCHLLHSSC
jgi:hypothetical protein